MTNIILCGFMGCGKSTVGKLLAKKTGTNFIDMDQYIEKQTGQTVKEIFEKYGENHFRDLEHKACIDLSKTNNKIIAAGGGTLTFERNINALKKAGVIIFLDADYEVLCERLQGDTTRPLLQKDNPKEIIKNLLAQRKPIYEKASDYVVKSNLSPQKITTDIIEIINNRLT